MAKAQPIPKGHKTLTAHLFVEGCAKAITFYEKAFGAKELGRHLAPDGKKVMHAEMQIGDSILMLADDWPEYGARGPKALGGSPVTIHLYVPNVDEVFERATKAGATVKMPLADMFWGDRYGKLEDPFGHCWSVATHVKDVSPEELEKASKAEFAKAGKK
jgi:uncharacterized glyoxalase superfamily protein PhnB